MWSVIISMELEFLTEITDISMGVNVYLHIGEINSMVKKSEMLMALTKRWVNITMNKTTSW